MTAETIRLCGIDPGIAGAIALVVVRHPVPSLESVERMPVRETAVGMRLTDSDALRAMLDAMLPDLVVIERQAPRPGNAASAMFTAGMMFGTVLEAVLARGSRLKLIVPTVWKRRVGLLHRPKADAVGIAAELFGASPLLVPARGVRTKDHVIAGAEAALMAWSATLDQPGKRGGSVKHIELGSGAEE